MSDRISARVTPDAFVQALWAEVERHPAVAQHVEDSPSEADDLGR